MHHEMTTLEPLLADSARPDAAATAAPLWRCPASLHRPGRLRARGERARSARRARPRYRDAATPSLAAQRRTEATSGARQAARAGRRPAAHRRADQPSRPRRDRVARGLHARRVDRVRARLARPALSRQRLHAGDRGRGRRPSRSIRATTRSTPSSASSAASGGGASSRHRRRTSTTRKSSSASTRPGSVRARRGAGRRG